jgi:hypothetical protein
MLVSYSTSRARGATGGEILNTDNGFLPDPQSLLSTSTKALLLFRKGRLSLYGPRATNGSIVQPLDDSMSEYGAVVEWYWQWKTKELGEKPATLPLCPPQIPHGLFWARTWPSAVRSRWLTTWAMARSDKRIVQKLWNVFAWWKMQWSSSQILSASLLYKIQLVLCLLSCMSGCAQKGLKVLSNVTRWQDVLFCKCC